MPHDDAAPFRAKPADVRFILNGVERTLDGVDPAATLLQYLREDQRLTGTKEGCAEGDCGACTVVVADLHAKVEGVRYRAVNACLLLVASLDGKEIRTVESLGSDARHPIHRAMTAAHASQCGFCTPGFVMSLQAMRLSDRERSREALCDALAGNLCRCTGYRPILAAGQAVAACPSTEKTDPESLRSMERGGAVVYFAKSRRVYAPDSKQGVIAALAAHPDAVVVAGGTDVMLEETKGVGIGAIVLSLHAARDLAGVELTQDALEVGAATTIAELIEACTGSLQPLASFLGRFGSEQVRNVATVGGNLATASPIGDLSVALIALGATVALAGKRGERSLEVEQFCIGYRENALLPGEIIVSVTIPLPSTNETFFAAKLCKRFDQDIASVSTALLLELRNGEVASARVACGGVAEKPSRVPSVERALTRALWNLETLERAIEVLAADVTPIDDHRGSADFRLQAAGNMLARFFAQDGDSQTDVFAQPAAPGESAQFGSKQEATDTALSHESAEKHAMGLAPYVDDIPEPAGCLHAAVGLSEIARAKLGSLDLTEVAAASGVAAVATAADIPGENEFGEAAAGDPVFANGSISFFGQVLFAAAAQTRGLARAAVRRARVETTGADAVVSIEQAEAAGETVSPNVELRRGETDEVFTKALPALTAKSIRPNDLLRSSGRISVGAQEHFYLEGQVSLVVPNEGNTYTVYCSTQHPAGVQRQVSRVLGLPRSAVTVEVRRLGGGFGGKETQAAQFACVAAVLAHKTRQAVKLRLDRDEDMAATGKRHDFRAGYNIAYEPNGRIRGYQLTLASRCGHSPDLSAAVNDRAMFHADNAYYLENVSVVSHRLRTNTVSATAFRGFGAPQSMMAIESAIDDVARAIGKDPLDVRLANIYGPSPRNTTPYGSTVDTALLTGLIEELVRSSSYRERRRELTKANAESGPLRRGLALTPVKFGISFTTTHLNQASALLHVYADGSIHLSHGGAEMGQGVATKVAQIVAAEFGVSFETVAVTAVSTAKTANSSATAASSSTDLNGAAARNAARTIKARIAECVARATGVSAGDVEFADGKVGTQKTLVSFGEAAALAYAERVSLSATGFYRTPDIGYDPVTRHGRPFLYFAHGAAVSQVCVDMLTGESAVERVDILHDCGKSINPAIDRGQIEGGFVQGMGWLTSEEIVWDDHGRLATSSASTYKIPTARDVPADFRVSLLSGAPNRESVVGGSKGVGEPPLMLAISVFAAIKDAIGSLVDSRRPVQLDAPATPERVLRAVYKLGVESETA